MMRDRALRRRGRDGAALRLTEHDRRYKSAMLMIPEVSRHCEIPAFMYETIQLRKRRVSNRMQMVKNASPSSPSWSAIHWLDITGP